MVIVKILGAIDLASAVSFLMLIFGMDVPGRFLLFCALLLIVKGLFILLGDILSIVDLISAVLLILSIVFPIPSALLWIPAFVLLAKGVASFF